jgi:hypothetical protein
LPTGWPDEFAKKIAQNRAKTIFLSKLVPNYYRGKSRPCKLGLLVGIVFKNIPMQTTAKTRPIWSPWLPIRKLLQCM